MGNGHIRLTAHCSENLMGELHITLRRSGSGFSATVEQAVLQSLLDRSRMDEWEATI